jgi:SAM-dependent methyltransferase
MRKRELAEQFKQPSGLRGYFVSRQMEKRNTATYAWVLPQIKLQDNDKVLEIGYGTGVLLNSLARVNKTLRLFGVDFSRVMCFLAKIRNRGFIRQGRMSLAYGDVLNYGGCDFNVIFAINVIYFWDDLPKHLAKIRELLAPGGRLYLYMSGPEHLNKIEFTHDEVFNKYSLEQVLGALKQAGYRNPGHTVRDMEMGAGYLIMAQK